jgi:hypothetical protein
MVWLHCFMRSDIMLMLPCSVCSTGFMLRVTLGAPSSSQATVCDQARYLMISGTEAGHAAESHAWR